MLLAMQIATILWAFCAAVALILAVLCGLAWLVERRERASLMLCILGIAGAVSAYAELCMMHSVTTAEYGEWLRWLHVPVFLALIAQLLFVHYYLGTGRLWLMWAIIFARSAVLIVNFSVHPNFNFSNIISLRQISLFGEKVSAIGVAVPRDRGQWFAVVSLILLMAYLVDAAAQRWRKGGWESKRKALAIGLGIVVPMLCTVIYGQLLVYGVLQLPYSNLPWFLGTLLTMAYELGREFVLSRRARLELAELRTQLAQRERVSMMGQLASTLAHELAQPLTATAVNVETALKHLESGKPDLEELRSILADIGEDDRRATEIIAGMRRLFKRRAIEMKPLRVDDVMRDVAAMVRPEATSKRVLLDFLIPQSLPRVFGDRVHLSQVLLNLVVNSIHAVQSGPFDGRRIVVEARADDTKGQVEVTVRDSGPGIPDNIAGDIFKPFFTTKSEGMGMGLALARMIIEAHGGRLWIDHQPGHDGAIFRFTLRQERSPNILSANVGTQTRYESVHSEAAA
jgi:signal transduction histidine kinase